MSNLAVVYRRFPAESVLSISGIVRQTQAASGGFGHFQAKFGNSRIFGHFRSHDFV